MHSNPPADAGLYWPLATATLDTTVFDVVHMFSELSISAVPILDDDGDVVDLYEAVDVFTLLRTGAYEQLDLTIRQALERRPADFPGVTCCTSDDSLASIFALLKSRRIHRVLVLEPVYLPQTVDLHRVDDDLEDVPLRPKGRLVGLLSLSDILRYIVGSPPNQVSS